MKVSVLIKLNSWNLDTRNILSLRHSLCHDPMIKLSKTEYRIIRSLCLVKANNCIIYTGKRSCEEQAQHKENPEVFPQGSTLKIFINSLIINMRGHYEKYLVPTTHVSLTFVGQLRGHFLQHYHKYICSCLIRKLKRPKVS